MRGVLVRSLLVIGVGGLALAGVLYVASTVDSRPPEVLSIAVTQPVGGDPQVALSTTSIEVAFNEPVETDEATAIRLEPAVEGTASWSGTALIFTPADPLELSTGYEVHVGPGIRDLAGNEMSEAPPVFTFETAGRPRIVAIDPEDGTETVPIEQTVAITFSTLMDTAVVEEQLRLEPGFSHDLRWAGELLEIVPEEPLRPDTRYEVSIGAEATDAAGVAIGETLRFAFRTVAPGLQVEQIVPADQVDGIAPTTAIAVIFDRPIDVDSVAGDAFSLTPAVAGSLEVTAVPGEEREDGSTSGTGRMLRFVPSGPLPPNTTFEVEVSPEIVPAAEGGAMAEGLSWTFTTGAPAATISNQITFLTDRSGVTNVWAMNSDGTGQHQVSAELAPVLDYAVAPDGSSLVVADGRRLTFMRPDGSDRRVITGDSHREFDPAYGPNGRIVAFGRADAATGSGLGLWQWEVGGGDPEPIDIPGDLGATPQPTSADESAPILRAPRFAPDGLALAFVDASGSVGVIELPGQRLTSVAFGATGPPIWMPDSSAVLLTGQSDGTGSASPASGLIRPLEPRDDDAVFRLARSGTTPSETVLEAGWRVVAVATDGTIAYATDRGRLGVTTRLDEADAEGIVSNARVTDAAFAPGDDAMVIVVAGAEEDPGALELLDLATGRRSPLAPEGWLPLWLP